MIPVPESASLREAREARWGPNSVSFSERYEAAISAKNDAVVVELSVEQVEPSNADLWREVAATAHPVEATVRDVPIPDANVPAMQSDVVRDGVRMVIEEDVDEVEVEEVPAPAAPTPAPRTTGGGGKFMSMLSEASREVQSQPIHELAPVSAAKVQEVGQLDMEELD